MSVVESTLIRPFVHQVDRLLRGRSLTVAEADLLRDAVAPLVFAAHYRGGEGDAKEEEDDADAPEEGRDADSPLSEFGIRQAERRRISLEIRSISIPGDDIDTDVF
jgi:hypothetical protein